MKELKKTWEDRTAGQSIIKGLDFTPEYKWVKLKVEVIGRERRQKVDLDIQIDGINHHWHAEPGDGRTETREFPIDKQVSISISGKLSISVFGPAHGQVLATVYYEEDNRLKEVKTWEDRTAGVSTIDNLNFPNDRKWISLRLDAYGLEARQKFDVCTEHGGNLENWHCEPNKGHIESKEIMINGRTAIAVNGKLQISGLPPAYGKLVATAYYEEQVIKQKATSWQDETAGLSWVENLSLDEDIAWESCQIEVKGKQNKKTECMISLLFDGKIMIEPKVFTLTGRESKIVTVDLPSQKGILLVPAYISNNHMIGAGAEIILTGFYK